ncbi:host attachment protein [Solirhodobacter olei]|uniref:baeRF12 domain-containing protein n=1 Tax=Solirhodobacter olei TaxID=2493082 RepID=UPI000FDA60E5|nr:host attachment protein [Solirhodobacter olei]
MDAGNLWILVMNATRARILRGLPGALSLAGTSGLPGGAAGQAELVVRARQPYLREVLSGAAMAPAAVVPRGHASAVDWRRPLDADESLFCRQVSMMLESHRLAGDFDQLAVFAVPDILEQLHQAMPAGLRDRVMAEIAKNLVALSEVDLSWRIAASLGLA